MKENIKFPHFIVKKSRNYYQNTLSGEYIRSEHLRRYIESKQKKDTDRQNEIIFK